MTSTPPPDRPTEPGRRPGHGPETGSGPEIRLDTVVLPEDRAVDIIGRLRARQARSRAAEGRLIAAILGDPQFAAQATIAELAQRAGVSEPTITRLSRSLGFGGTLELRIHLAQALAIGGAYLRASPPAAMGPAGYGDAVPAIAKGAHAALELLALGLAGSDVAGMARSLRGAGQILICGTGGGSSMAAVELQNRLFRLGLKATAQIDPQLQRMNASVLGPGDVLVAFSISGQVRSVQDATRLARQYGAHTLAVTRPDTPLAGLAQALLPLQVQEDGNLYKPSSSRFALLACVDILAMATAHAIGPGVIETLRRVRQSLATQDIRDPLLPIGD